MFLRWNVWMFGIMEGDVTRGRRNGMQRRARSLRLVFVVRFLNFLLYSQQSKDLRFSQKACGWYRCRFPFLDFIKYPSVTLTSMAWQWRVSPPFESWVPYLEAIAASSSLLPFVKFTAAHDLAASTEHDVPASVSTEPSPNPIFNPHILIQLHRPSLFIQPPLRVVKEQIIPPTKFLLHCPTSPCHQ